MDINTILRHLSNTGFHVLGTDGNFIYMEDPSCILRSFETFINYAWIIITAITALLLFGWAISMIRGAKNDIFINLRNLTLIFGILSATKPAINMIWGDDLFARGCKVVQVSIPEIQKILNSKNLKLTDKRNTELYEDMQIYDSAVDDEIPMIYTGVSESENLADKIESYDVSSYDGMAWGGQCTPPSRSSHFSNSSYTTGQYAQSDAAFDKAMNTIFRAEGGYSNNPFDSGGETKYGISKNNNPDIDVNNITRADAEQIAYNRYYKKYGIDKLPDAIRGDVFQVGWMSGPRVAIKQLQKTLGVSKTGKIDDETIAAAQNYSGDLRSSYLESQKNYLIGITNRKPSQKIFLNGWMKRMDLVEDNGCKS